jgi:peptidoglycan/xylan/chitin deacetylase (PgdA/CDA1 family)
MRLITRISILLLSTVPPSLGQESAIGREVAVTFDDLPTVALDTSCAVARSITGDLLDKLADEQVPATGFVIGAELMSRGRPDSARLALLDTWLRLGFSLGNHTFSHRSLNRTRLQDYELDVLKADTAIRALLEHRVKSLVFFRHPMLQTGRRLAVRDSFLIFLQEHGYRVAPVTIDNSDWIFAKAYDRALARQDTATARRVVEEFIPYMENKFAYYESRSVALFGREIRQVLLLHANQLNARSFDRLGAMMRRRGYRCVTLERALEDPAYGSPDSFIGEGGISWLDRWALTAGKRGSFFKDEPLTPVWIMNEAEVESE